MTAYHKDSLILGSTLAEYTIESVLGHGSFGITYLAHDSSLGAKVAIKEYLPHDIAARDGKTQVILPRLSRDAIKDYHRGLKSFVKEAQALARFKHPNIVRVLRFIEANGTAYTVMEYEQGQTLAHYLKQHGTRLKEAELLRIVIPVLNGLHAVHEAGLLHLDIKPENIYLRADGLPMLIDFGSARQAISAMGQKVITLTPGYAPMEQYPEKGTPGPSTDVYAFGATMYHCVSGKRPNDGLERYRALLNYKVDPLKPAVKVGGKRYQRSLLECIDWSLQIYAKDRPQTARMLQDSLMGKLSPAQKSSQSMRVGVKAEFKSSSTMPAGITSQPKRIWAKTRQEPRRWAIGTIGLVVLIGAVAYWQGVFAQLPDKLETVVLSISRSAYVRAPTSENQPVNLPVKSRH